MLTRTGRIVGIVFAMLAAVAVAHGGVVVVNPSFEEPALADGSAGTPTGWEVSPQAGMVNTTDATFAGSTYVSELQPGYLPGTASGLQCGYMDTSEGVSTHLYQIAGDLEADKTYTLTAAFGRQLNPALAPAHWVMYLRYDNQTTPVTTLALLESTDPGAVLPGLGEFVDNTISWTNTEGLSGNLYVVFRAEVGAATEVCIDNVRLTATPEPMSLVMFGTGILGILAYAWRRK